MHLAISSIILVLELYSWGLSSYIWELFIIELSFKIPFLERSSKGVILKVIGLFTSCTFHMIAYIYMLYMKLPFPSYVHVNLVFIDLYGS